LVGINCKIALSHLWNFVLMKLGRDQNCINLFKDLLIAGWRQIFVQILFQDCP
jgi:hypothetical protein